MLLHSQSLAKTHATDHPLTTPNTQGHTPCHRTPTDNTQGHTPWAGTSNLIQTPSTSTDQTHYPHRPRRPQRSTAPHRHCCCYSGQPHPRCRSSPPQPPPENTHCRSSPKVQLLLLQILTSRTHCHC
ncbi:hypothetical protein LOK49_LG09G01535 [Camellia lanceoleosa]|uniref:Uncharacterized protein n=1 Tax=Camellia lanceoleosa TaxID=1840588 RepID=A0ACC0GKV1_9ERIC|nr:hypothetical protein LOK49_LG09G01535 [Camellia lanceoleosa]